MILMGLNHGCSPSKKEPPPKPQPQPSAQIIDQPQAPQDGSPAATNNAPGTNQTPTTTETAQTAPAETKEPVKSNYFVDFSSDARFAVSGGKNATIRLYDLDKGVLARTFVGQKEPVSAITFRPDGKMVAAGSKAGKLMVWDTRSVDGLDETERENLGSEERAPINAHDGAVRSIAFSPDGRELASGGDDGIIRHWKLPFSYPESIWTANNSVVVIEAVFQSNKLVAGKSDGAVELWDLRNAQVQSLIPDGNRAISALAVSPDGKHAAAGDDGGKVRLLDLETHKIVMDQSAHEGEVTSIRFHPQRPQFLTTGADGMTRVFDVQSSGSSSNQTVVYTFQAKGKLLAVSPSGHFAAVAGSNVVEIADLKAKSLLHSLPVDAKEITSLAWSADDKILAVADANGSIHSWNIPGGQKLFESRMHDGAIRALAGNPQDMLFASGGADGQIRLWNQPGLPETILETEKTDALIISPAPRGQSVAIGAADGSVRIVDSDKRETIATFAAVGKPIAAIEWSPDEEWLAAGGRDGIVRVWKVDDGENSLATVDAGSPVVQMAFHGNGPALIAGLQNGHFKKWNLPFQKSQALSGHTDTITSIVGNQSGSQVVTGGNDRVCRLYNVDRGELVRVFEGAQDGITSVAQIADESWIAAGDRSGQLTMWTTANGELIGSVRTSDGAIAKVACNSKNRLLATASNDGLIRIWQAPLTPSVHIEDPPQDAAVLAVSSNGQRVALGLPDFTIAIRDTRTGEQLKTLTGHTKAITALGFSQDGSLVVSGSLDESVDLWNVESGERLVQWNGHTTPLRAVAVLSNGDELRACTVDGQLSAYTRGNNQLRVLQQPKKGTTSVAISPSGKRLALANPDGSVQLVDAESGSLLEKTGTSDRVLAISWCADDETWVSLDSSLAVKYWKSANLASDRGWTNAPRGMNSIVASADGSRLFGVGTGQQPTVWDSEGNVLQVFDWDTRIAAKAVAMSADGGVAVAIGSDGKMSAFHSSLVSAFKAHAGGTDLVGFADDRVVVSAGADSTISAWDINTKSRTRQFEGCPSRAVEMAVSSAESKLFVLGEDKKLYAWNLADGSPLQIPSTFNEAVFRRIGLNPEGTQMAALDDKGRFQILKLSDMSDAGELPSPVTDATAIELLRTGTIICAAESLAFISRGEAGEAGTKAHEGAIVGINAFPNREEFITAGEDGKVKVWSLSGDLVRTLVDAGSPIRMFAVKADGKEVATLGSDNRAKIWSDTGEALGTVSVGARLKGMQFTNQSPTTIATISENQIKLLQAPKGKATATISTIGKILAGTIDAERGAAYVGNSEGSLQRYSVEPERTIDAGQKEIQSLAFSKNGGSLASGGEDFSICVWKVPNAKLLTRLKGHTKPVTGVAFGRDEGQLVSMSLDKTIRAWNVSGSKLSQTMNVTNVPLSLSISADGKTVAVSTRDKVAAIYDVQSGKPTQSVAAENSSIVGVQYIDKSLITLDADRHLSMSETNVVQQFPHQPGPITSLDVLKDGSYFVTTGSNAGMKLFDFNGKSVGEFDTTQGKPKSVSVSANNQFVAGVNPDGPNPNVVLVWNIADRKLLTSITAPASVQFVMFEPDTENLIAVCDDRTMCRYRAIDGNLVESIAMIDNARCEPTFHSSGEILSLDRDDRVRLYQPGLNRMDVAHTGAVTALIYSSNGNLLFSGGEDGRIIGWDMNGSKPVVEFQVGTATVNDLRLLPNQESLIASYSDSAVRVWPLKRKSTDPEAEFMHKADVRCTSISNDGKLMVTGGADKIVHLWTLTPSNEREVVQFRGHEGTVSRVVIAPDNKTVISFGNEDSIRVWKIPDDALNAVTIGQIDKSAGNLAMAQPQDAEIDRLIKSLSAPGPGTDLIADQVRLDELRNGKQASAQHALAIQESAVQRLDREIQNVERKIRSSVGQNRSKLRKDLTILKLQKQIENSTGDRQLAAKKELEEFQSGKKDFVILDIESERPPGIDPSLRSIKTDFTYVADNFKPVRLALSHDGSTIAAGREPNNQIGVVATQPSPTVVQLWDVESGSLLRSWKENQIPSLLSLAFSSNDRAVFSSPDVSVFNVLSGEWKSLAQNSILSINRGESSNLNAIGLTTDLVKQMPVIRFFDTDQMTFTPDFVTGYEAKITAITFSADGKFLYYCERGSRQHKLFEMNLATKEAKVIEEFEHSEPWHRLITDGLGVEVLCVSSDRKALVGYGQYSTADYRLKMWTRTGDKWTEKNSLPFNAPLLRNNDRSRMWLIKDRLTLCVEDMTGTVQAIDLTNGKQVGSRKWKNVRWGKPETARSEDGVWYLWGDDSGRIEVWDMRDQKSPPRVFKAHSGPVVGLAVSANGDRIISAGEENLIKVWNPPAPPKKAEPTRKSKK